MNTYLQMSGLAYVILIAIMYFSKKNINTLENKIFSVMIIHTIVVLLVDIISRMYAIYYPITKFTEYLFKTNIFCFAIYIILYSYYVFALTSNKNVGLVEFDKNPNREYFKTTTLWLVIFIALNAFVIYLLPVTLIVNGEELITGGLASTVTYVTGACCMTAWVIMLLRMKEQTKHKKYISIYIYIILGGASVLLQLLIPQICFISTTIAFITVITFYTIENPDVNLITKLNDAKAEAETANKSKTDFLSSMSHEIRTPLNAIVGFGQALAKEDISGTAKEEVHDIIMASNTLLEIVNGILDISKIESNNIEIINGEYSTKKIINETTSLINARIGSKPIDFKILIDENLPAVLYGDSMRVKQIMINLLTNAVKYTNEGRILFQIKAKNEKDICKMTIEVADTGIGMTEESLEQLFTKFQRFDMSKNVNVEGTGLGMAITKGLIDLMNGDIQVKSKYEEGSTFTVTIEQKIVQQKLEEIDSVDEIGQVTAFNAAGSKVLVVDDNKINLKVAERLLRDYNITVETANSGSECLDKILDGKVYDLIFMDIMMPKMSGIEVLENLKNIVGFKMPVVALTADVISGMEEKYISKGFDDCLAKPIVEDELYYMLRKFLKESKGEVAPVTTEDLSSNDSHNVELLESNRINVAAGLELLKDMEMYEMTLEEFYNELQNKLSELKSYKEAGNMDDYAILAHALKTEARYVGCNELGDMAYEHELAGKASNQALVDEKFEELSNEVNRVYDVIKRYFS
ncbi:MAG: response regulator [Firmicutes bacterium]|nr:response regulator [Bacillota bacterium]